MFLQKMMHLIAVGCFALCAVALVAPVEEARAESPIDPVYNDVQKEVEGAWKVLDGAVADAKKAKTAKAQKAAAVRIFNALGPYKTALEKAKGIKGFNTKEVSAKLTTLESFRQAGYVSRDGFGKAHLGKDGLLTGKALESLGQSTVSLNPSRTYLNPSRTY